MNFKITPAAVNALHVVAAILPTAAGSAILGGGGNTAIAITLFASSILSALAQSFHFSASATNLINNLPMIVAAVIKAAETPAIEVPEKK
jgi:hypothetical protein